MPEKDKSDSQMFDLDRIKQLIRLMEKHDLTEVKLEGGDQKWVLKRGSYETGPRSGYAYVAPSSPPPVPPPSTSTEGPSATTEAADESHLVEIKSPTVGTFYQSAQPGDPPFVKVGDRVKSDTTVCIVEAMKVLNHIPAEVSGTISKVLVQDAQAVEFGQPLFLVTPG
jgi:acetyl-CoA carboxylase biotin carboxyl carrier protein